jgi:hypothetical protein
VDSSELWFDRDASWTRDGAEEGVVMLAYWAWQASQQKLVLGFGRAQFLLLSSPEIHFEAMSAGSVRALPIRYRGIGSLLDLLQSLFLYIYVYVYSFDLSLPPLAYPRASLVFPDAPVSAF